MSAEELAADEAPADEARSLGEELLPDLIMLAASLAVQLGVLVVLAKRDALTRGWMRLQERVSAHRDRERQDVAVAAFRAQVSAWEHEQAGR